MKYKNKLVSVLRSEDVLGTRR